MSIKATQKWGRGKVVSTAARSSASSPCHSASGKKVSLKSPAGLLILQALKPNYVPQIDSASITMLVYLKSMAASPNLLTQLLFLWRST